MSIFKNLKSVDLIITLGILIALIVGFVTFKNFRQTADKQIEATSQISFDVYIRGITYTGSKLPMANGDKTFISIRNVPYSDLDITSVKSDRRKIALPRIGTGVDAKKSFILVDDPASNNLYDITVTLKDTAKITKDGAVVGGNKVKIGLPITLEGKDYKFNGTVSNIQLAHEAENQMGADINTTDDIQ